MQLAAPAVSSSSVDEVQPASCCWCRCRPAGVTAETTAVDQRLLQALVYCKPIDQQGDVLRSARVPLLYPCRYAREKLSVRESDRLCPPLAFCPKRISVGRADHHRKRMHSIRRFRTKLTFRRNILLWYNVNIWFL